MFSQKPKMYVKNAQKIFQRLVTWFYRYFKKCELITVANTRSGLKKKLRDGNNFW